MKNIVQEVLLVLIITIISIVAALFIAHSVRSETLPYKEILSHPSESKPRIHNSGDPDVAGIISKKRL